jgi:Diguanylate cyclase, GGDEF domain
LLKSATATWQAMLRPSDLLARIGGEEFGLVLPTASMEQAVEIVDRLRTATPLAQAFSAGVALWDGDETSDQVVARADHGLYRAKQAGQNQVVAPTPGRSGPRRPRPRPAAPRRRRPGHLTAGLERRRPAATVVATVAKGREATAATIMAARRHRLVAFPVARR